MAQGTDKIVKIHNKSDRPDNIVETENEIDEECEKLETQMPRFLRSFFIYLRGNVLPMTRLAYLRDIRFFLDYLVRETDLTEAESIGKITLKEFDAIRAADINIYLDYCRKYRVETEKNITVYENHSKTLARKKSSVSVMFKQLYRDELISRNITDGFDPIRVQKADEREIKALQDDEVMIMLDAVSTGTGLTEHERAYWEKTRKRDKAILILFLTYGLRLSELQQLNVSSFNFSRGEFKIYRKRGKESIMPMNDSVTAVIHDYLNNERKEDSAVVPEHRDALFLSLQGRRMTQRQIRELVKKYTSIALKTSRSAGYSPHKLRATAATSLIGRGNSIYDVAALLDHEQVTTTQLYARHKANVKRDLVHGMEWEIERRETEQYETVRHETERHGNGRHKAERYETEYGNGESKNEE
ncbi:tyrosine-type recombinase/integrase [Hornefia butyriciproducens]|uniref:tyrosine-type recombinase/integrase n=1 Tax=Hornefia butyriciproducens TaxID=2652293 RepID=UPI002A91E86A|nr:tyrosine-type recombinase/integrase [Hornefia butyriciproducens]MCI7413604.1 tyrosine-type recombinase/integrase [Clostridiales bacterium]MDY6211464.1 tyrosine-type recombinase/integrase [Hornefia butyriciproducens]